jgi:ferrous-iron efflux pump FieF
MQPDMDPAIADRWKRRAAYASMAVAGVLIFIKLGAWLATGAVSMLSTLIDSLIDFTASTVNLVAVRHATQPADNEHRFGHGKAEPLAGMAQAAFVTGSAAFLIFEAGERLLRPATVANTGVGIAVMLIAIALTLALVIFQSWVVRRTGSIVISADSLHYRADLLVNASVIVALVLSSQLGWAYADPVLAIVIAIYIVYGAWGIFRVSLDQLMDHELPDAERQRIRQLALAHERVIDVHDLRSRRSGTQAFVQLHIELDPDLSLQSAHDVADEVMASIKDFFPSMEIIIHQDPYGVEEERPTFD